MYRPFGGVCDSTPFIYNKLHRFLVTVRKVFMHACPCTTVTPVQIPRTFSPPQKAAPCPGCFWGPDRGCRHSGRKEGVRNRVEPESAFFSSVLMCLHSFAWASRGAAVRGSGRPPAPTAAWPGPSAASLCLHTSFLTLVRGCWSAFLQARCLHERVCIHTTLSVFGEQG